MVRTIVSWICIVFALLLPSASSAEFLLCLGEDGHIAIERSLGGSCATEHAHGPAQEYSNAQHAECGPCADIPLFQSKLRDSSVKRLLGEPLSEEATQPVVSVAFAPLDSPLSFTPAVKHALRDFLAHPQPPLVGTVILVI